MYTSTKYFHEIGPCAYRNWKSQTDCYLLHGYCRSFNFVFGAKTLDSQNFVVDFGGLKAVKRQLEDWFDHTVILQVDDPLVHSFKELSNKGYLKLQTFPIISCEGLAEYVGEYVDDYLTTSTGGRAWVISCEMIEAEKNTAIYTIDRNDPDRLKYQDLVDLHQYLKNESQQIEFVNL